MILVRSRRAVLRNLQRTVRTMRIASFTGAPERCASCLTTIFPSHMTSPDLRRRWFRSRPSTAMTYRPFFRSRWSRNRHRRLQYRTVTAEALERIATLHAIEKEARVPPEQRVAIRQAKAAPRRDDLGRWSRTQLPRVSVRNPAGGSHPVCANPTEARVPIP